MEPCNCVGLRMPADELLQYQYISDFFIALAYFCIPVQLLYFVRSSSGFPYKWVLIQFGAFIVLCGTTHLINLWTFDQHTRTVDLALTVAKILTAVVSCATALSMVRIFPLIFKDNKVDELEFKKGLIPAQSV